MPALGRAAAPERNTTFVMCRLPCVHDLPLEWFLGIVKKIALSVSDNAEPLLFDVYDVCEVVESARSKAAATPHSLNCSKLEGRFDHNSTLEIAHPFFLVSSRAGLVHRLIKDDPEILEACSTDGWHMRL